MDPVSLLLSLPVELEVWLILGYVAVVLAGARLCEALARVHFERARRYAERGFEYDADADHYHCPQGERLALHLVEPENRLAVYRAPASQLQRLPLEGVLHAARRGAAHLPPLAAWAETDVGRFHRRLSLLMFGVGVVFRWAAWRGGAAGRARACCCWR